MSSKQFISTKILSVLVILLSLGSLNSCKTTKPSSGTVTDNTTENEAWKSYAPFEHKIFHPDFATLQVIPYGYESGQPIVGIQDGDALVCSFDYLGDEDVQLFYRIIHCTADWELSDISAFDYLDGSFEYPLNEFTNSFSSLISYEHYEIELPNEDFDFKISGNYVVQVYAESEDSSYVILNGRFFVNEDLVNITPQVLRSLQSGQQRTHQNVKIKVQHDNIEIQNPFDEIKIVVQQNNRFDNLITDLQPTFVKGNELTYNADDVSFEALKEYRIFDIRNLRQPSPHVAGYKELEDSIYVFLQQDKIRSFDKEIYEPDFNGVSVIDKTNSNDPNLEADYVYTHFILPFNFPINSGELYVVGGFNNYVCDSNSSMTYHHAAKSYYNQQLVKQGYHNYLYALREKGGESELDFSLVEGNVFETENEYTVYVYYRPFARDYDALIGVQSVASVAR